MGIDLVAGGRRVGHKARTAPAGDNLYLKLLCQVYGFLARRTDSAFAKAVLKRLYQAKSKRAPLSLSRLVRYMGGKEDKIAVVVGTVTGDLRMIANQKKAITVCALRFTESARAAIVKNGGECLTFDQLALKAPTGSNTVLLRGPRNAREANKHFGHRSTVTSVNTHCNVKPYVRSKGRKFEKARGRRRSNGFKI